MAAYIRINRSAQPIIFSILWPVEWIHVHVQYAYLWEFISVAMSAGCYKGKSLKSI